MSRWSMSSKMTYELIPVAKLLPNDVFLSPILHAQFAARKFSTLGGVRPK